MSREMSAGWYTLRDGSMSYWNGLQWTETTPPPGTPGAATKKPAHKHWWSKK